MTRLCIAAVLCSAGLAFGQDNVLKTKTVTGKVTAVTIYRNNALVTREVDVPDGVGLMELVVSPLPPATVGSSLYSEGTEGIRVMATRYRTRATREDVREDVRKIDAQVKDIQQANTKVQADIKAMEQNLATLSKLETFTTATMAALTEKGQLNADATLQMIRYITDTRTTRTKDLVGLQQLLAANNEQVAFLQRQLQEISQRTVRTEHDAVIIVDKRNAAAGKVRLNYLTSAAAWRPQYKFRAAKPADPVILEYQAAIQQRTGEDWTSAQLTLSTAEPMLNAAPPDLAMLSVNIAAGAMNPGSPVVAQLRDAESQSRALRGQAQQEYVGNRFGAGGKFINDAAALEQCADLLAAGKDDSGIRRPVDEGPSVTYHLAARQSVPSRNDEQVIEIARIELKADFYLKAVPVLTPHVYRLANLVNRSEFVLLPGEATMYLGTDFVGRATLPLVAIGEQFTAGFGVDPQVQVARKLAEKTRTVQGANQVLKFEYRILVSSYKTEAVRLQLWDRLPHSDNSAAAVTLISTTRELSKDPLYVREDRPKNLLRWDLTVEPGMAGEKALSVGYEFRLEMAQQVHISGWMSK
jgi:uncharacterized protein (TIGR02231 family)